MQRFGAHVGGNLKNTAQRAVQIGAECVQVFASAPQQWRAPSHNIETIEAFRAGMAENGIGPNILHGVYLLNPASPNPELVTKTIANIADHLSWAETLGATGLVIHLGSAAGRDRDAALAVAAANLKDAMARYDGPAMLYLENSAGAGANIGRTFEELAVLADGIDDPRVGVCLDTCHLFGAGYDISTPEGVNDLATAFDIIVGLVRLKVLHVNDSKGALGSRLDRHENIGKGLIGEAGFAAFLQHPAFNSLPLYLEVPGLEGGGPDAANVDMVRGLAGQRKNV